MPDRHQMGLCEPGCCSPSLGEQVLAKKQRLETEKRQADKQRVDEALAKAKRKVKRLEAKQVALAVKQRHSGSVSCSTEPDDILGWRQVGKHPPVLEVCLTDSLHPDKESAAMHLDRESAAIVGKAFLVWSKRKTK